MTGLEVLGEVAAALQIGQFCYNIQKRYRGQPADRALTSTVYTECQLVLDAIDKHILNLTGDTYRAVYRLHERLSTIKVRIE